MDDYESLGIELAEPETLDGGTVLQSMQAESPELLAGGLPFSRCTQAVKQAADAGKMTADFVIVTRAKDVNRHGNMVQIAPGPNGQGLRLDEYQHNPVVLLDHGLQYSLPIGLSADSSGKLSVKLQKTKAVATVYFSQQSQIAEDIFRLVDEGTLRMSSIGFMPTKAMRVKQARPEKLPDGVESLAGYSGYDFVEAMLWEWSITAIGADAGALRQCLDCGEVAGKKFHPLLRPMLQRYADERPAWSPGLTLPAPADPNPLSDFEEAMQRIGQHLTEQVTQAIDARLKPVEMPVESPVEPPAKQAACGCQNKGVDTPAPTDTKPEQSAAAPVLTPQQIADAMKQTAPAADPLVDIIRQAVGDIMAPAVQQIADGNQRLADRLQTMTGALPE